MRNKPNKARFNRPLMILVIVCGVAACIASAISFPGSNLIDPRFLVLAAITVLLGSRIGIEFSRHRIQITVSDTFVFLTLLLFGAEAAVLVAATEAFWSSFRFSKLWVTRLFNAGLLACSTFISTSVVSHAFGSLTDLTKGPLGFEFVLAVTTLAILQYTVNSTLAAFRESLKTNQPFIETWREHFLWTSITYFAGATAAAATAKLIFESSFYAFIATVPIISIIYFTYQSYRNQLLAKTAQAEQAARHARAQELISQRLRKSEEHFRSAFDYAAVGMALVSTDGRWLSVNPALCKLLGYTDSELLALDLQSITHIEELGESLTAIYNMVEGRAVTSRRSCRFIHKNKSTVWATVSMSSVLDDAGQPMHFILQAQDITERKIAEEQLHHAAFYDSLTSLPNRALFTDQLELAIRRSHDYPDHVVAVLFLDLDRFKNINDSLGHVVGDQLLKAVAGRLSGCVRSQDTVSRFGGDEFAVLLNGVDGVKEVMGIVERILGDVEKPYKLSGYEVVTSTSVGITLSTIGYECTEDFLRDADTAMYRAKEKGKGRFEVFDKFMHARALSRLKLENDLRYALERKQFEVFYQPIIDLRSDRVSGFEALIRWNHPERGQVPPSEFIPLAEDTDLIIPIGQWILHEACRQVREWQLIYDLHEPLTLAVNLSGKQFKKPDLVESIKQILFQTGFSADSLRLEITESVIMEDAESATVMLRQLRSIGVQLSIDDFGTGYSSLSYLHRFPVNILKIDRSFVSRMSIDEEALGIVETVVTLAGKLKMKVVAEGIETHAQSAKLKAFECDYGQGYLFSKPLAASAAMVLLMTTDKQEPLIPVTTRMVEVDYTM
jgi:diguanylate cyclase (GGDEF)-like protein/PAS domain S-box-containing protein